MRSKAIRTGTVDYSNWKTLLHLWGASVRDFPRCTAFNFFGHKTSYQKAERMISSLASRLLDIFVQKGDRVAILLPNTPAYTISCYAIMRIGAIYVPCDPRQTEVNLRFRLENSGAGVIIVLDALYAKEDVRRAIEHVPKIKHIIFAETTQFFTWGEMLSKGLRFCAAKVHSALPFLPMLKRLGLSEKEMEEFQNLQRGKKYVREAMLEKPSKRHSFRQITSRNICENEVASLTQSTHTPQMADLAEIIYSTGTTGPSKGVMLSHENRIASIRQCIKWIGGVDLGAERFLVAPPLVHTLAETLLQYLCNALGGEMVFVPNAMDLRSVERIIREQKPTIIAGPPKLIQALIIFHKKGLDLSFVKFVVSGGGALPVDTEENWAREVPGIPLIQGFGLTEAMPTHCNPRRGIIKKGSIGLPLSETKHRVMVKKPNGSFREVEVSEQGELWIQGPQVFEGYWRNSKETRGVMTDDGWLRTGDLVSRDEDDYFFFRDREKNLIVTDSGNNVFPGDIESVLRGHPAVEHAGVVSVAGKRGGKIDIMAFVVPRNGFSPTQQELLGFCGDKLAEYQMPRFVEFLPLEEFPLTAKGEPSYPALREKAQAH